MDRKNFFKKACLYGICSCAGMTFLTASEAYASDDSVKDEEPDWQIKFVKARFSKLIDILDKNVDESTKNRILENLGRECSRQGLEHIKKYVGDIDGFLKSIAGDWAESAIYNKEKKEIKIVGKKSENCFCPFVDKAKMSKDFCACSLGWQKETFKTIMGQQVDAKVDESVLRGGSSCSFTIIAK